MANRWIDGFDYLASADLSKRFQQVASGTTVDSGGRNGSCLRAPTNVSQGIDISIDAQSGWTVGCAFKFAAAPSGNRTIVRFFDGTTAHVTFGINSAGKLIVLRGTATGTLLATGTTTLSANTWYYVEIKVTISDTVGVVEVQLNGVSETLTFVTGTSSTQDTRNGGNATANVIELGQDSSSGGDFRWDDLYIHDNTGGVDDTFWGDIRVVTKSVDGSGGHTDFTPSTGSNWQNVDDATPNDDTDYNESSTVNHIDSMTTAALGVTGTVKGVSVLTYARKTDAGAGSLAPLWRISSTDYAGTGVALATDYHYNDQRYRVSPATSSAWTTTEIDGAEVGYKRTA